MGGGGIGNRRNYKVRYTCTPHNPGTMFRPYEVSYLTGTFTKEGQGPNTAYRCQWLSLNAMANYSVLTYGV